MIDLMKCSMNGSPINDSVDGVWDDGEWISWDYINSQLDDFEDDLATPIQKSSYDEMLIRSKSYFAEKREHLPIYGEIGELYIESRFGLVRHAPNTQGSDGKIGDFLVEVKTISPMRSTRQVRVKRAGDFGVLAIVKIDVDFRIDAKLIQRSRFPKGKSRYMTVSWNKYSSDHAEILESISKPKAI